jgi:hypothetical protein
MQHGHGRRRGVAPPAIYSPPTFSPPTTAGTPTTPLGPTVSSLCPDAARQPNPEMKDTMTTATNSIPITSGTTRHARTRPITPGRTTRTAHTSTRGVGRVFGSLALGGNYVSLRGSDLPTASVVGSYVSNPDHTAVSPAVRTAYVTLAASDAALSDGDTIGSYVTAR